MEDIRLTIDELKAIFAEWWRMYEENPEIFMEEMPNDVDNLSALQFLSLLEKVRENQ